MNQEIENMCYDVNFDITRAKEIINTVNVDEEFYDSKHGFIYTLLSLSSDYANISFVKFLLDNGANPNLVYNNGTGNVLWDLQYAKRDERENGVRLNIAELLLRYGANPRIKVEGEDLYFWATHCHIEIDEGASWNYREAFINLLEKYGA